MALRDTLEAVLREYDSAKLTRFVGNPLAAFISKEAVLNLEKAAGPAAVGLLFAGSAGAEDWAEFPWLAAFDPVVTDSVNRRLLRRLPFPRGMPHFLLNKARQASL
jgi:hypothetical protein